MIADCGIVRQPWILGVGPILISLPDYGSWGIVATANFGRLTGGRLLDLVVDWGIAATANFGRLTGGRLWDLVVDWGIAATADIGRLTGVQLCIMLFYFISYI